MSQFEHKIWTFRPIIYDILCRNFQIELVQILLFCYWLFCWVQCVLSATFYVTVIILHHTKNIYKNMQLETRSPENKFPDKYINWCNFHIQIDQHLQKLLQKYKGVPILWIAVYVSIITVLKFACGTLYHACTYCCEWTVPIT